MRLIRKERSLFNKGGPFSGGGLFTSRSEVNNTPFIRFSGTVVEGAAAGTVVGTATLHDPLGLYGTITWSLTAQDYANGFAINSSTGVVTVGSVEPNFETFPAPSITIQATDGVLTPLTLVATVSVTNIASPVNTVAPVISGTYEAGQTLSCTTGTWTAASSITYTYQWYRGIDDGMGGVVISSGNYVGDAIGSATSSTYVLTGDDVDELIFCDVTATIAPSEATTKSSSNFSDPIEAAPIPASAILVHFADQYSATPRPYIPNQATGVTDPVSANLLLFPRRVSANYASQGIYLYGMDGATNSAATAPDGSNDASTLIHGSGGPWNASVAMVLAAGTYTIGHNYKRNTGSDQQYKLGDQNSGTYTTFTATSAWQRGHTTFAHGGGTFYVDFKSVDDSAGANIQFCDLEVYAGSSDLGPSVPSGHWYLGKYTTDTPTCSGGELDLSGSSTTAVQLPSGSTATEFTLLCCLKEKAGSPALDYLSVLSRVLDFTQFGAYWQYGASGRPYGTFNGATVDTFSNCPPGLLNFKATYQVISFRYKSGTFDIFFDDVKVLTTTGLSSSGAVFDDLWEFASSSGNTYFFGKVNSRILCNTGLSDGDLQSAVTMMRARAVTNGLTVRTGTMLIPYGDSLTAGSFTDDGLGGYADRYVALSTQPQLFGINRGRAGLGLGWPVGDLTNIQAMIDAPSRVGKKNIFTGMVGTNEFPTPGVIAGGWLTDLFDFTDALRANGWLVAWGTVPPRGDANNTADFISQRATANAAILGAVGTHIDAAFDFSADSRLNDPDDATYFRAADKLHFTNAGQAVAAGIYATTIDAL